MPFNPNRTPPKSQHRDRSLSAGRPGYKRKAEGSAEKERKSRSSSKKRNISKETDQVNADTKNTDTSKSKISEQVKVSTNTSKTAKMSTGRKPASDTHCSGCGEKFDDDNCVLCECCKRWFHATCVDLTADEITAFTLLGPKAHWYCDNCDAGAKELYEQHVEFKTRLDKMEKTVNHVSAEQSGIKENIKQIQNDLTKDRDDINAIYEDTSSLKVREIANNSKIKANSEAVSKIKTDIVKIETQQKSNTEKLSNIKATIRSEVSEMVKEQVVEHIKGLNLEFPPLTVANNAEAPTPETQEKISKFREFVNSQCRT